MYKLSFIIDVAVAYVLIVIKAFTFTLTFKKYQQTNRERLPAKAPQA